jgi:hypothetical protein
MEPGAYDVASKLLVPGILTTGLKVSTEGEGVKPVSTMAFFMEPLHTR